MTVVYIDVLFLLNLIVDYLLLTVTAKITGEIIVRLRVVFSALVGAAYAALLFVPGLNWLSHPICKLCSAVLMVLIAYGTSRCFLRLLFVFWGASAALGGVVLALQLIGNGGLTLENGVLYTGFDIRILLVTVILSYIVLSTVFERTAQHGGKRKDIKKATISMCRKEISFTVLVDTGNTLRDPVQNLPVMVAEGRLMQSLFCETLDLSNPVESMERIKDHELRKRVRLLPYRSVGVSNGMLLAVRVDWAVVGDREWQGILIALSPNPVSDGGGYQALIGEI